MAFPDEGTYVFPGGLTPLTVIDGLGRYWEPTVWMVGPIRHERTSSRYLIIDVTWSQKPVRSGIQLRDPLRTARPSTHRSTGGGWLRRCPKAIASARFGSLRRGRRTRCLLCSHRRAATGRAGGGLRFRPHRRRQDRKRSPCCPGAPSVERNAQVPGHPLRTQLPPSRLEKGPRPRCPQVSLKGAAPRSR